MACAYFLQRAKTEVSTISTGFWITALHSAGFFGKCHNTNGQYIARSIAIAWGAPSSMQQRDTHALACFILLYMLHVNFAMCVCHRQVLCNCSAKCGRQGHSRIRVLLAPAATRPPKNRNIDRKFIIPSEKKNKRQKLEIGIVQLKRKPVRVFN